MLGFWSRVLFLLIIVGVPVLVYQYYLSDYFSEVREMYDNIRSTLVSTAELTEQATAATILNEIQNRIPDVE